MAEGNWATFGTSATAENQNGSNSDDWADFGGFESAVPVTDPQATSASGLISWAAVTNTAFSANTDANLGTNTDTSTVGQAGQSQGSMPAAPIVSQSVAGQPWSDPFLSSLANQASLNTSAESTAQLIDQSQAAVALASQNLDLIEAVQSSDSERIAVIADPDVMNEASSCEIANQDEEIAELAQLNEKTSQQLIQAEETRKSLETEVTALEGKLSIAEQEKLRINKDLEELLKKNQALQEKSSSLQEDVEVQKKKYSKLQEEHSEHLQEIRQAGHDALAIIVEEYKELSRQAVLQQQSQSQIELQSLLKEERNTFKSILKEQEENIGRVLEEERAKCAATVTEALDKEQEKHKTEMEVALAEERERNKQAIDKAVEKAHKEGAKTLQQAAEDANEKHTNAVQDLRESMEKMFQEERAKLKSTLEEAVQKERECSKEAIDEAVSEERTRSRESVSEATNTTREQMTEYLQQKQELDTKVRQRQYVAVDLFLESARTQLRGLMDTNEDGKNT